ncbi:hypothetical protein QJQ45_011148 [Haematococcus lacustris]|nr:hypothetical protein QJQ45_011148 [Haematococcus lacustris]
MVSSVSTSTVQCRAADSGVCPDCATGKMHRRVAYTLPSLSPRVKGVLDLVHTDACGPFHVASVGGYSYVVTFLDEYNGLSLVESAKARSNVLMVWAVCAWFEGAHARTQDWLNKLIDGIYKGKMASDELRARQQPPLKPLPLVDFVFQHLAGMYGTKDMVNQYTAQLVATLKTYYQADPRVSLFYRFLYEQLPLQTLSLFLDGLRKLSEPARLPCVDYPPDWAPKKGSPPCADVRKCLWVADRLLMKRHPKTAYSLAVSLSVKSEPVPEAELRQYFVAPGYYSADIVNMREYERSRAEFRRMQVVVFLEALCEEYERCEGILLDVLPAIFKKWDTDQDSFISQGDILPMFEHMVRQGVQCDDVAREAQQFWQLATAVENDGIMPGLAAAAMQSELPSSRNSTRPSGMVSIQTARPPGLQAFMAAGKESGLIRAYVRLHKTPPAKLRLDNSDVEAARILLLLLIRRHWALHKEALLAAFPQAGPLEPQLRSQAELLEKEGDGARKALALHGLLKLMIGRKLDRLVGQLSADSLALKVEPDFEESLSRLTSAVKQVLYGADVIVVDEILAPYDPAAQAPMTHVLRQRQIAQVFHLYNELKGRISEYASRFLSHHSGISYFVARWRAEKNRRQSSRKTASSTLVEPGPGSDDCGFSFH